MTAPGSLNHKEIDCILNELDLANSRIQDIYQPSPEKLIFEIYGKAKRFKLLFVFNPQSCRLHLLTRTVTKPKKLQRFVSFLRAHIRDKKIISAEQLGKERIVKIQVSSGEKIIVLWVRLWSAAPNLIVTDQHGVILDALYRKPKRGEVSGGHFSPQVFLAKQTLKKQKEYTVREFQGCGSFNKRVEGFYYEYEYNSRLTKLKRSLLNQISTAENNLLLKLEKLNARFSADENFERYKQIGDIIMSSLHLIKKGDRWLNAEDYYNNNKPLEISLKTELTPLENAENYYNKYKTAHKNKMRVEKELINCRNKLKQVREQKQYVLESKDPHKLSVLNKKQKKASFTVKTVTQPGLHFFAHGFKLIVGRSARENESLLRSHVRGNDYWFHCRDYPGAYVFVKNIQGKTLPLDCILDAGNLALSYSKAKTSGQADVYYTQVKYLKKIKGGKPGSVIPTQEKNIHITLDQNRLKRLKGSLKLIVEK
jgi:predicted ribosome quality control (RQC) complex YloA/Tae2 family protein